MAEDPNAPNDPKAGKSRSFASFLLIITLLVVCLAYVGGRELTAPKKLSQDQYLHHLYTGSIERQEFRGNMITGRAKDGTSAGMPFEVQFDNLSDREKEFRNLKAERTHHPITVDHFNKGIAAGDYSPNAARFIVANNEEIELRETENGAASTSVNHQTQDMAVLVHVYAKGSLSNHSQGYYLPEQPSSLWLNVEEIEDLAAFTGTLASHVERPLPG